MSVRKGYNRYFIIFQEEDKGYGIAIDRQPAGYAKIEVRNGKCRITVYAQNIRQEKGPYTFCLMNGEKKPGELLRLGEVKIDSIGTGETFWEFGEDDIAGSGQSVDRYDVAVLLSGGQGLAAPLAGFAGKDKVPWRDMLTVKAEPTDNMRGLDEDELEDAGYGQRELFMENSGISLQAEDNLEFEEVQMDEEAKAFREYDQQLREAAVRQQELQQERERERERERGRQGMAQLPFNEQDELQEAEMRRGLTLEPRGGWEHESYEELEAEELTSQEEREQQLARGHGHGKGSKQRKPKREKENCMKHESSSEEHVGHMADMKYHNSCYDHMDQQFGMKHDSSSEDHMGSMPCGKHEAAQEDSSKEHHGYAEDRMPYFPKLKGKCIHADRFHQLLMEFEEVTEKFVYHGIQGTRWWRIPAHYTEKLIEEQQYPYMSTIFHLSMAYPQVDYLKYFFRTGYYYFGIRYDKQGEVKYLIFGIRGRNHPGDHPHRGATGFRKWVGESPDGMGTWLMFYNPVTGNYMTEDN